MTVWRELRRLKEMQDLPAVAKEIVEAADKGDWKRFTQRMGVKSSIVCLSGASNLTCVMLFNLEFCE
ncbi:hypothetical protein ACPFUZ_003321 [Vibrio cholerae]